MRYIFISSLVEPLKAFDPKLYTQTVNVEDFLCIVVPKVCFCPVKTQEKQTAGPSSFGR